MIEPTDEMIYAFAGEPEITATDAHAIRVGLTAALAIIERDYAVFRTLTRAEAREAADLYVAGASLRSLMDRYGCSNTAVMSALRRLDTPIRRVGRPRKSVP